MRFMLLMIPKGYEKAAGFLGGAVATHVRVGDPLFTHVLFPAYLGAMLWVGLYLGDDRLRTLVPLRSRPAGMVS